MLRRLLAFAVLLIVGATLSPGARAAATQCPSMIADPSCYNAEPQYGDLPSGEMSYDYLFTGILENNRKIEITFTAYEVWTQTLVNGWGISSSPPSLESLRSSHAAELSVPGTDWGGATFSPATLTFSNTSGAAETFYAYFLFNLLLDGDIVYDVVISSVPLPPGFLLFVSGLMALAGVAAHKKARGQA